MGKYIVEFIGTFFLVAAIGLTGNPLAIGATLMVMVYFGGHISGAAYNPAVTVALMMRGKLNVNDTVVYIIIQVIAATLAAVFCHFMYGRDFGGPHPDESINILKPLACEILFTFALTSVVLAVATSPKTAGNSYYGLAIGFTVMCGAFAVGSISGGAFNPAVGTGPLLSDAILGGGSLKFLWLYWVGPLVGAVAAAIAYKMINPEDK